MLEFISWVMTNQNLGDVLGRVKVKDRLRRFLGKAADYLRQLLGFGETVPLDMFSQVRWNTGFLLQSLAKDGEAAGLEVDLVLDQVAPVDMIAPPMSSRVKYLRETFEEKVATHLREIPLAQRLEREAHAKAESAVSSSTLSGTTSRHDPYLWRFRRENGCLRYTMPAGIDWAYNMACFKSVGVLMLKSAPGPRSPSASESEDAPTTGFRRSIIVSAVLVLTLAVATTVATTIYVSNCITRSTGEDLQARTDALARTIDKRLRTYTSVLDTIAQSHSLRESFDLSIIEWEARRVGTLFGGWFVLSRAGDVMDILMSTADVTGRLPPPEPRTNYPEVMRAEAESIRTYAPVVSDAFMGRTVDELIITTVRPVETQAVPAGLFMYFSVTLRDITSWLEETVLDESEFAAIADGSRRIIARSQDNEDFLLAGLPEWYIAFSEGRNSGIAIGPPAYGGEARLFAMQRLDVAPGWTLAISRPVPNRFAAIYLSPWPMLSGLGVLLLGSVIAGLFVGRRQAQAQAASRAAMLAELRSADARKSRLIAVLAHDLRTPLIAMLGSLDLFREGTAKPEHERILERLKTDSHGMLTLIDDVLELARLGAGEARLRPEPFAPLALLTQVGDLVRPAAERNGTEILVQIDDLPDLVGDVTSLRRVLLNFATNAVKATRGGSIRLSATETADCRNDHIITFAVTDTGRGISPDDIPRLFRDFGMLERDNPTTEGTGLGLAICRRLATAMGGEVGVESTPGLGSRFWLRVPLPKAEKGVSDVEREADDPLGVLVGLKVLVAEDHDTIRQLTCATLARAGMNVTEAADGEIAVERAEAEAFDLILMDLQMPRLDGDAAAVRIRGGGGPSARARIICVTAHQSPEIALMLSDLTFDASVRKPLDLKQLAKVMQEEAPASAAFMSIDDFDTDNLTKLREIDGGALLIRTLRAFAAEIETTRTDLAGLIGKHDSFGAGRLVHRLVGVADILGARTLSATLRRFEDLIRDDDIEGMEKGSAQVDEVMTQTLRQVDTLIAALDHQGSGEGGRVEPVA